jgi:hypothetical protein
MIFLHSNFTGRALKFENLTIEGEELLYPVVTEGDYVSPIDKMTKILLNCYFLSLLIVKR